MNLALALILLVTAGAFLAAGWQAAVVTLVVATFLVSAFYVGRAAVTRLRR
jgi:hypothetical protein